MKHTYKIIDGVRHTLNCSCCGTENPTCKYNRRFDIQYYYCSNCNTKRVRAYKETEIGRININKAVKKSTQKHYYKHKARLILNYHVQRGHIIKPTVCSKCSISARIEAHHHDYSKPLDVTWLCRRCHVQVG